MGAGPGRLQFREVFRQGPPMSSKTSFAYEGSSLENRFVVSPQNAESSEGSTEEMERLLVMSDPPQGCLWDTCYAGRLGRDGPNASSDAIAREKK